MDGKKAKYASTRFGIVKPSKGQSVIDHASYISRNVFVSEQEAFGKFLVNEDDIYGWKQETIIRILQEPTI